MRYATLLIVLVLAAPLAAIGQQVDSVTDSALRSFLGACPGPITLSPLPAGLSAPTGMTVSRVKVEGGSYWCEGAYYVFRSRNGSVWIGNPWPLDAKGALPERIRNFAWERLHQSFSAEVGAAPGADGLLPVTLSQLTEWGNVQIEATADPAGTYLFMGRFQPFDAKKRNVRYEIVSDIVASSPSKGPESADVTLVEFSDFQCPACASAHPVVQSILEAHAGKVRYVRADLPLVSSHPWAMPAAIIGRAIWKQSPETFWTYKDRVYADQSMLNSFTLGRFAQGIVEDAGLDLAQFNRDIADAATAKAVRDSMGAAFSAQLVGTPTYFVNGQLVAFGHEGETLEQAIAAALAE